VTQVIALRGRTTRACSNRNPIRRRGDPVTWISLLAEQHTTADLVHDQRVVGREIVGAVPSELARLPGRPDGSIGANF